MNKYIFKDYLEDILEYAEKAHRFLEKIPTVDALQKDERTLLANVVWRTVREDLPPLRASITQALSNLKMEKKDN